MNKTIKRVLTTIVTQFDKDMAVPCNGLTCYATLTKSSYANGLTLEFGGDNGYWPAKDYVYMSPEIAMENEMDIVCNGNVKQENFLKKNGIYVLVVKIAKRTPKNIKI